MLMELEIKDVNQVNPYATLNGKPIAGMERQYQEFEQARAELKFKLDNNGKRYARYQYPARRLSG
jgi:hypothetical protein